MNIFLSSKLLFLFLFAFGFANAQYQPKASSKGSIIEHSYYSLSYSEENEQAEWVYYKLSPQMTNGEASRSDNFRPDPKVKTGSATLADYAASGYDRGHLAPAGDMSFSKEAMSESFYMSNMSPQEPSFNRGAWKNLESLVRLWGSHHDIYVVTGPIFKNNKGSIGSNNVTIPGYYYKVIYSPSRNEMIGFVLPNEKLPSAKLENYITSVDNIEQHTGIDFFYQLEDNIENELEKQQANSYWQYSNTTAPVTQTKVTTSNQDNTKVQCKGITQSGNRCKRTTTETNGYCHQHQP